MKAKLNYLHIAPRKVRKVADLIRNKPVKAAKVLLSFSKQKSARDLAKLLASVVANAKHNFNKEENNLYVSKITVNEGPVFKRFIPKWRGTADMIRKKTSHISVTLSELPQSKIENLKSKKQ